MTADGPGSSGTTAEESDGDASATRGDETGLTEGTSSSTTGSEGTSATGTSSTSEGTGSTGTPALSVDDLVPGDLVIAEVMFNPHCFQDICEWIEVVNLSGSDVDLLDLRVRDIDSIPVRQGRITSNLVVAPGERVVLARGMNEWPYRFQPDAVYGPNPGINNGEPDLVSVSNARGVLDQTALMPFDAPQGQAWALRPEFVNAQANDDEAHWCLSASLLDAGDFDEFGTPGSDAVECAQGPGE